MSGLRDFERRLVIAIAVCAVCVGGAVTKLRGDETGGLNAPAPELVGIARWINSDALKLADLRGKVVVLHFWTFGCINCQHNLPLYNQWFADFPMDGVRIIGVHTPETTGEGDPEAVAANVQKLGIKYPVAIDNERSIWDAYGNRYWPSVYLIDKQGRIRLRWDGELESGGQHGDAVIREKVRELIAEKGE